MCLILLRNEAEARVDRELLYNAWTKNSDGVGMMRCREGRLEVTRKIFKRFEQLERFVTRVERDPAPFALHLRKATRGAIDKSNVHPFRVLSKSEGDTHDVWLMHNGTLATAPVPKSKGAPNDTRIFIDTLLRPYLRKYGLTVFDDDEFVEKFDEFLTKQADSKLVLLDDEGYFTILNESSGDTKKMPGFWLSNTYMLTKDYSAPDYKVYIGEEDPPTPLAYATTGKVIKVQRGTLYWDAANKLWSETKPAVIPPKPTTPYTPPWSQKQKKETAIDKAKRYMATNYENREVTKEDGGKTSIVLPKDSDFTKLTMAHLTASPFPAEEEDSAIEALADSQESWDDDLLHTLQEYLDDGYSFSGAYLTYLTSLTKTALKEEIAKRPTTTSYVFYDLLTHIYGAHYKIGDMLKEVA